MDFGSIFLLFDYLEQLKELLKNGCMICDITTIFPVLILCIIKYMCIN